MAENFLPDDEQAITAMLRAQVQKAEKDREDMLRLAQVSDRIRFALEMAIATAEGVPDPKFVKETGEIVEKICAMSRDPGAEATNMIRAMRLGLAAVWRIADASYRGFKMISDPLADKSTPVEI